MKKRPTPNKRPSYKGPNRGRWESSWIDRAAQRLTRKKNRRRHR